MADIKHICGNCTFCIKDDGIPYCIMKDLYTTVRFEDECDEYDIRGNKWFSAEKKEGKK